MDERTSPTAATRTGGGRWCLLLLAGLWLAMLFLGGRGIDHRIMVGAHVNEPPGVLFVLFATKLGDWAILLAATFLATAWLFYRRQGRLGLLLLGSTLAGRAAVGLQKLMLARLRPENENPLVQVYGFAFPSGHAANSMIVYLTLALLLTAPGPLRRRAVIAAVTVSILVGISRVMLAVHWPSDVIGGWAFGLLWVMLTMRFAQTLNRNSSTSPS